MSLNINLLTAGRDISLILTGKGYNVFDIHASYDDISIMVADDKNDRAACFKLTEKEGVWKMRVCWETNQPTCVSKIVSFPDLTHGELIKVFLSFVWNDCFHATERVVRS